MTQPLILAGMHRSGTSMMTRVLMQQGVFLGSKRQGEDEAVHFLELNDWMLQVCGGAWDYPMPCFDALQDDAAIGRLADIMGRRMHAPYSRSFLGPTRMLRYRGRISTDMGEPWGFKDPRSSITLPVWMKLFPGARVLRMKRHGLDVASSLRKRYFEVRERDLGRYRRRVRLGLALPNRRRIIDHPRCATIEGGLGIWDEYETTLDHWMRSIPQSQTLTISYESYLANPHEIHGLIRNFLDLPQISEQSETVRPNPERANAWRRDEELRQANERFRGVLSKHGY